MSNEEYERKVTVGQAINLAHKYIIDVDLKDGQKISFDGYKKLLQERTEEFRAMIIGIQESYANVSKAIPETVVAPPQPVTTAPTNVQPGVAPPPTFKFG